MYRIVDEWNNLLSEALMVKIVNGFKTNLLIKQVGGGTFSGIANRGARGATTTPQGHFTNLKPFQQFF